MDADKRNSLGPLALVLAFAGFGFFSILYWGVPSGEHVERTVEKKQVADFADALDQDAGPFADRALAFAVAVRDGDCEGFVPRIAWVQDRLEMLRAEGRSESDIATEAARLCETMTTREADRPLLVAEGLSDQYVFLPGCTVTVLGSDSGRTGLARDTESRVWLEVRYAELDASPQDVNGNAISGLIAGINFSADGSVLKAGLAGNVEIDLDSLRYSW